MINVSSLVEPLGSFPILPYLIQALRAVIARNSPKMIKTTWVSG
jgi:hypothetical protein